MGIELCYSTAESVVDAPGGEVQVFLSVVIAEQLGVEGDDVVDIAVGYHHGVVLAEDVVPRADGRIALTDEDVAGLAVVITVFSIGHLHHVGRPYHLRRWPVHHYVLPVDKVLADPHLSGTITVTCAIGGGIEIPGFTELTDGGVGEVPRDKRVRIARRIPCGTADG